MPKTSTKKSTAKPAKTPPPSKITLSLDAPGMTPLHRAGLGGLAATLYVAERILKAIKRKGLEPSPELAPFAAFVSEYQALQNDSSSDAKPPFPWTIDEKSIELRFGQPENAARFFEALSTFAFQISTDKMIFLPGQYRASQGELSPPPPEVRARLQQGLTQTFLQHQNVKKLGSVETKSYHFQSKDFSYTYRPCFSYKHQTVWKEWCDPREGLKKQGCKFGSTLYPGAVVSHIGYAKETEFLQSVKLAIALTFALVGALTFPVNKVQKDFCLQKSNNGKASKKPGILLVPSVDNLKTFAQRRSGATPMSYEKTLVTGLSDAVLLFELNQREVEIENQLALNIHSVSGCEAVRLRIVPWGNQQNMRYEVLSLAPNSEEKIERYAQALSHFGARNFPKKQETQVVSIEGEKKYFWKDSIIRPFIADNIVLNKPWFAGFAPYIKRVIDATKKASQETSDNSNQNYWKPIQFEREGLNNMINDKNTDWKLDGARPLVFAVQESLSNFYGRISREGKSQNLSSDSIKNRWNNESDKWRIAFFSAKTENQFRKAFADMVSRAKPVSQVADKWFEIMRLIARDWECARDLALIALAGYKGKEKEETDESEPFEENEEVDE